MATNEATALAETILDELVHQGVREFVLCPGSRSAPLAFAALAAERAGRLRLHVRIDERSAGFLALGLAKVSGAPVPVACTSGTAVANLTPAVVEASFAGVPLVALTADRPPESRGIGSPQTIDQVDFFGGDVRAALALDQPRPGAIAASGGPDRATAQGDREARGVVAAAVAAALGGRPPGRPGPVQLNVGFRMPLVPPPGHVVPVPDAPGPRHPPHARRPPLAACHARDLTQALGAPPPPRGIIVAGDLPISAIGGVQQWVSALAAQLGWPLLHEPTANLAGAPTGLDHGVLVAGAPEFLAAHRPELVLTVGAFGLSRPTLEVLRAAGRHVAIDLGVAREVCDPLHTARLVIAGVPLAPPGWDPDPAWLSAWVAADRAVGAGLRSVGEGGDFTGITAAAVTAGSLPRDGLMLVAASWPVRHLEAFVALPRGVRIVGNRGANGIDGLVSTAWGAALAHQGGGGGPAVALMGDLAFLHDHNGLLATAGEPEPDLVVVVVDNGGGGIFHQLEQGGPAHAEHFERLFGTPHGLELGEVARAAGRPVSIAGSAAELADLLARPGRGVRVVIAAVAHRRLEAEDLARRQAVAREAVLAAMREAPGAGGSGPELPAP